MQLRRQAAPMVKGTALAPVISQARAVEESIDAGTSYPPQRVPRFTILLTLEGEARVKVAERVISLRPNTIVTYAKDTIIQEATGQSRAWRVRYLMLSGIWPNLMTRLLLERGEQIFSYDPAPQRWLRLMNEAVEALLMQPKGWAWQFSSRLAELACMFTQNPAPPGEPKGMLERLEWLVDHSPERPWRLPEMCVALGVSASTLTHRFRELAGCSPALWVRRRRIEVACRLLEQGLSVVQVSERLGFANPFHFSRAFKALSGQPPSHIQTTPQQPSLHLPRH